MKGLSNHDFQGILSKVTTIRDQLKGFAGTKGDDQMEQYQLEKNFKAQTEKWRNVGEKATFQWLKKGDLNTAYLHACMRNRKAQNHITRLIDAIGIIIEDAKGILEEIVSFYRGLLVTTAKQLTFFQPDIMTLGSTLIESNIYY